MKKLTEMQKAIRVVDATMGILASPGSAQEQAWAIVKRAAENKDEIANGSVASGQGSTNSAITQLPPECGKCIHKRVCPAWVLSLNNAMDVSINRCLYFEAATAQ